MKTGKKIYERNDLSNSPQKSETEKVICFRMHLRKRLAHTRRFRYVREKPLEQNYTNPDAAMFPFSHAT